MLAVLRVVRTEMIEDLMQRLRDGKITAEFLETQRLRGFKGRRRAKADLRRVFRTIGKQGIEHVSDELTRQES